LKEHCKDNLFLIFDFFSFACGLLKSIVIHPSQIKIDKMILT